MERTWGEAYRNTVVCIDEYENGIPSGRFYNPFCSDGKRFRGMMEFLSEMENTLEIMDFPKSFTYYLLFFLYSLFFYARHKDRI